MKIICLLFLLFIGITSPVSAFEQRKSHPGFYMYNTTKNTAVKKGEAKITLHFSSLNFSDIPIGYQTIIYYSVNKASDTLVLGSDFTATIQIQAKKTVFKFWAGPGYDEVISDTILLEDQTTNEAQVRFNSENMMIQVDKPVIYLQSPVKLDFSLKVDPTNDFIFTYPVYTGQWKGTLYPDGEVEISGQKYPYLFWDAKQNFKLRKHSNGYRISKKEVIPFLENQLSKAGLTSTERTDFITYWGPRLIQYESVFIQFFLQEDCKQFATISCDPEPTAINRIYIGFCEWNPTLETYILPIDLPTFKRAGFNLLEWGGFELKTIEL